MDHGPSVYLFGEVWQTAYRNTNFKDGHCFSAYGGELRESIFFRLKMAWEQHKFRHMVKNIGKDFLERVSNH